MKRRPCQLPSGVKKHKVTNTVKDPLLLCVQAHMAAAWRGAHYMPHVQTATAATQAYFRTLESRDRAEAINFLDTQHNLHLHSPIQMALALDPRLIALLRPGVPEAWQWHLLAAFEHEEKPSFVFFPIAPPPATDLGVFLRHLQELRTSPGDISDWRQTLAQRIALALCVCGRQQLVQRPNLWPRSSLSLHYQAVLAQVTGCWLGGNRNLAAIVCGYVFETPPITFLSQGCHEITQGVTSSKLILGSLHLCLSPTQHRWEQKVVVASAAGMETTCHAGQLLNKIRRGAYDLARVADFGHISLVVTNDSGLDLALETCMFLFRNRLAWFPVSGVLGRIIWTKRTQGQVKPIGQTSPTSPTTRASFLINRHGERFIHVYTSMGGSEWSLNTVIPISSI